MKIAAEFRMYNLIANTSRSHLIKSSAVAAITVALAGLSACSNDGSTSDINSTQNDNLQAASPATDSLFQRLSTGRDGDDSLNYWRCDQNVGGSANKLSFRFFSSGDGFANETRFSWSTLTADSAELETDRGNIKLNKISFGENADSTEFFNAIDGTGEALQCQWKGPLRNDPDAVLGDIEGNTFLLAPSGSERQYGCETRLSDGSVVGQMFSFNANRSGQIDGLDMHWFLDEGSELVISSTQEVLKITQFTISETASNSVTFTGDLRGSFITCTNQ